VASVYIIPGRNKHLFLDVILLSCLFSELQEPLSPGIEPMTFIGVVAIAPVFFCSKKNFSLGAVLLSCLVPDLQVPE
jgi:hypothetical protein